MITQTPLTTSKKVALTITLPTINFAVLFEKAKKLFFSNIYNPISNAASHSSSETISRSRRLRFPKGKFSFNKNKLKVVLPIVFGIIVIAAIVNIVKSLPDAQSRPFDSSTQINAPDALATINLDRKFSFPLKDDKGVVVGNFDYVIESAAIQKQIIVKGQRATAVNGREFMLLNLKITNNLKKTIQLSTRDYIRLITASNASEQLALDIHNDPVEVQAISTKYTRVGIALDDKDTKKTIHLKVGEIDGTKQNIDLNFKY